MIFSIITLLSGLSLSAISAYFSIVGLLVIFPTAFYPILIMGISIETAKVVAVTWLKRNWDMSPVLIKIYLIISVIILMLMTSIGAYGFLSKAHLDQGASTIDNSVKVERLDQQIAREKSIIADDEKVIQQLDATVNSYIAQNRTTTSLATRKAQASQRKQLREDIDSSHKRIDEFSGEKLKLQSEVRKQELDVGPLRYIAELFYGVEQDANKNIEAAVRMFTLLIVSTLDTLAIALLIAANHTMLRLKNEKERSRQQTTDDKDKQDNIYPHISTQNTTSSNFTSNRVNSVDTVMGSTEPTKTEAEEPVLLPTLSNVMEEINAPKEKYNESSTVCTDQIPHPLDDSNGSKNSIAPRSMATKTTGANSDAKTDAVTQVSEEAYRKENMVMEESLFGKSVAPVTIIRSPSLTKVSSVQNPLQELQSDILSSDSQIVSDISEIESKPNIMIMREVSGNNTHFIPQKVKQEEKVTQETEILQEIRNGTIFDEIVNKYPKVLSWLDEFKRS